MSVCPVCGSARNETLASVKVKQLTFLSTSRCHSCTHVYRSVIPKVEWFDAAFEQRDTLQQAAGTEFINLAVESNRSLRYQRLAEFFARLHIEGPMLDIGCGSGVGTRVFKNQGFLVCGIEPDESRARIARDVCGLEVFRSLELARNSKVAQYSLITLVHSLEHIQHADSLLLDLQPLLSQGGYIYIEVPDFNTIESDWNDALYLAHFSNFSEQSLLTLILKNNLYPICRVYSFPNPYSPSSLGILARKTAQTINEQNFYQLNLSQIQASNIQKNPYDPEQSTKPRHNLTFVIPELNDISMSYRPAEQTTSTIEQTFRSRCLHSTQTPGTYLVQPAADSTKLIKQSHLLRRFDSFSLADLIDLPKPPAVGIAPYSPILLSKILWECKP